MNEVVREFLLETHENLAQLDLDLVTLEKNPSERDTLGRVFRILHTIKGTAGFLGLPKLQAVAHAGENLLTRLRDGEITFDADVTTVLLRAIDAIRKMLAALEATGTEGDGDYSDLIQSLEQILAAKTGRTASPATARATSPAPTPTLVVAPATAARTDAILKPPVSPTTSTAHAPQVPSVLSTPPQEAVEPRASAVSDSAIRVDVGLLDKLMTLVGELVLVRNQIVQIGAAHDDAPLQGTTQRLNLLTTELQTSVMKTRLQPISNIWSKFPRVVRDLAVACGKQVQLETEGQDTELDKTIIEAIRDPLTHLVRNAVDHGIELPALRLERGKPAEGRLYLRAFHEGGKVIIEMTDDGGGIDPQRVRDKAIQAKVVTPQQVAHLGDRELVNLIFLPGFSTADRVTQFSGRGVGMDVVRTHIEKIGGTVVVESALHRGTTIRMKIPLTLAIIPALTVTSGGDRYAIPQVSLLELVRLDGGDGRRGIEYIHEAAVCRLRGNLLPLVYLDEQLGVSSRPPRCTDTNGATNIVVLQADDRQFGLVVDAIHDTEEIVVKPLQKQIKGIGVFAGATIMGDGKVALILDVVGLAHRANVVAEMRDRSLTEKQSAGAKAVEQRHAMLLFSTLDGGRMAIPLSLVARLEEFSRGAVERTGKHEVVQYRGQILPLVPVNAVATLTDVAVDRIGAQPVSATASRDVIPVVVYTMNDQQIGLVVGQILDIVEESIASRSASRRPEVSFSAVIQERVTDVLDVEKYLQFADPGLLTQRPMARVEV